MRRGGRWFRVLGVIVFIRVLWVHSGAPLASYGSFGFVGFILTHIGGHAHRVYWVHSGATWTVYSGWLGSLVSLKRILGVIGFIRVLWVHSGGRWFH